MTNTAAYLVGGKLGDVFHTLWVVKRVWEIDGIKGVIVFSDRFGGDVFSRGLHNTWQDCKQIIESQEYIQECLVDDGRWTPDGLNSSKVIFLNAWRKNKYVSRIDWTSLLSMVYGIPREDPCKGWIKYTGESRDSINGIPLNDVVVVHQSLQRINKEFPWKAILSSNNCVFLTSELKEYDSFEYKHLVNVHIATNLSEMTEIISGCKAFCGNQSSPLALAAALGKTCYCQLYILDRFSYIGLGSHIYHENIKPPSEIICIPDIKIEYKIL